MAEMINVSGGAAGVASVSKLAGTPLTGDITLSEGVGVTLLQVGQNIAIAAVGAGGAPTDADYLVGTANLTLTNEIVVGTSPGGELGGTWASPTVDASHSGSTHAATQAAAEATAAGALTTHAAAVDPHAGYLKESDYNAKGDLISASANDTPSTVTVGANDTILMADSAAAAGLKWVAPATPSTQAFGDAAAAGTSDDFTRGDHKHGMMADPVTGHVAAADPHTGYVLESLLDAKGDLIAASADNTPAKVTVGADGTFLKADSAAGAGVSWAIPADAVLVGPKNVVSTVEAIAANTYVHVGRSLEITSAGSIEIAATSILEITA